MAEEDIVSDFDLDLVLQSLHMRTESDEMERIVESLSEQIKISRERLVCLNVINLQSENGSFGSSFRA